MLSQLFFFQNIFLGITIIISLLAFNNHRLMERCVLNIHSLKNKEYSRLILSGFIHADYTHLIFNMISYYFFAYLWGRLYSQYLGLPWWLFALFYSSAIIVVNLSVWYANRNRLTYSSLGASGGVSAIITSCILLLPWETIYVFIIPVPAILFAVLYIGFSSYRSIQKSDKDNINHLAHLIGSLYGVLFSIIVEPNVIKIFIQRLLSFD